MSRMANRVVTVTRGMSRLVVMIMTMADMVMIIVIVVIVVPGVIMTVPMTVIMPMIMPMAEKVEMMPPLATQTLFQHPDPHP